MNVFTSHKNHILDIIRRHQDKGNIPHEAPLDAITVEPPRDALHGDLSSNVAMVLAKSASMSPRALAEMLVDDISKHADIKKLAIAGPGFINIHLKPQAWHACIYDILKENVAYGNSNIGNNERVNIEFVSANPTGPMHIGHVRGAVFGDSLARTLSKAGYDVVREFYINDAGAQINLLAQSVFLRYREALGENIGDIPEGLYPGEYLVPVGKSLAAEHQDALLSLSEEERYPIITQHAIAAMLQLIKHDLAQLGVEHDVFTSEKALHDAGKIEQGLAKLTEKGLIYEGILEPPKGKKPEDWEEREQTLFKSSEFGDDVDRPIKKSDGSWTYFAADVAYHLDKLERGFNKMILELGADHGGYLKRITAAVKALSDNQASIDIKFHQLVNVVENGEVVKMSKRAGNFVLASDVIEAVGKDIIRFVMLTRKNDVVLDFDLAKVKEQSKDNPVFYVQYAHARACSVLRHAKAEVPDALTLLDTENIPLGTSEDELQVMALLASWPRIVESAAQHLEPHRIAFYIQEVAAAFHGLWNKGKDNAELRFILKDDAQATASRLALVKAVAIVIASGLNVFNVTPMEEMH